MSLDHLTPSGVECGLGRDSLLNSDIAGDVWGVDGSDWYSFVMMFEKAGGECFGGSRVCMFERPIFFLYVCVNSCVSVP